MSFLDINLYCLIKLIDQFWSISSLVVRDFLLTSPMMLLFTQLSEMFFNEKCLSTRPKPPSYVHSFFTVASFIMALRYAN